MLRCFALAVLTAAGLTACGTGTPPAAPVETVTATVQPTPTTTTTATAGPGETDRPEPSEAAAERKTLPDVVGMNLQEGQDTLQAAGFYVLNDKDATGQNRLQVLDRNWVVTKQSPAGGRKVTTDTLITLYAKKIGE
ncbi:PASTA domain-containing protein [Nonomuraea sp. GTA35]|uniref:PASTA domain-containing protein n=1 Tax=Nonomuraea sp. GTA35 TaxID=1676746 RepID=UPI0035C027AD